MLKLCKLNQDNVIRQISKGNFDSVAISQSNLVDDIILSMQKSGILYWMERAVPDKRYGASLSTKLIIPLSIAAKMKIKMSVSDIPYAIQDHRVLASLGYNIVDTDGNLKNGIMSEGTIRNYIKKFTADELIFTYNKAVQKYIMPSIDASATIHILDATDLEVNLKNENYEGAEVTKNKHGEVSRGYKLGTIRGIIDDVGIIEEICLGSLKTHDLNLTRDMIMNSKVFKKGDILINDRGFLNRELINFLKNERGVDTYVPLKENMTIFQTAITAAQMENKWIKHPTRENQKIALVTDLSPFWESKNTDNDVPLNAAVVWDTETNKYFAFVTTNVNDSAKQIVLTYELRPEIEEDYRQLKDFWLLDHFKSTKLNMNAFHIITVLFGYLFFQIFTTKPEGEKYANKCLPTVLKNYNSQEFPYLIFYVKNEFGILSIMEFCKLYAECDERVRKKLETVFEMATKKEVLRE